MALSVNNITQEHIDEARSCYGSAATPHKGNEGGLRTIQTPISLLKALDALFGKNGEMLSELQPDGPDLFGVAGAPPARRRPL